jgi:hypothetical protein
MRMEDREEYVDMVAQAVIDRIEERDRLAGLVEMVARRVIELQQAQAKAEQDSDRAQDLEQAKETQNAGERNHQ